MDENQLGHPHFGSFLTRFVAGAMALVAAIALAGVCGWVFGIDVLTELVPDAPRMSGNTALSLLFLCGALWLIHRPGASARTHAWARLLAGLAVAIGVLTLVEYITEIDVYVDELFEEESAGVTYPGHMSPHVAAVLICMGLWLIVLDLPGKRWELAANALAPLAGIGVLAGLIGWLYGVDYIQGSGNEPGIAPQSSVALVAMFFAILASRSESPWMKLVTGPGSGGHLMRRFVPIILIGAVIAGYVLLYGIEKDLWGPSVGTAFVVAVLTTILLAGLVQTSREIEWADHERRRLEERLVALADRDPLTNVFNRRRFDEDLTRQFSLFERHGTPAAILSIDLDDFKAINDTYGHAAGDELLLATAEETRKHLRASDLVARFGGDEFVVMLPDVGQPEAIAVAEKLLGAFRAVKRTAPGGHELKLRASIGIAASERAGWPAIESLLIAADKALYVAKREGGDCVAPDGSLDSAHA